MTYYSWNNAGKELLWFECELSIHLFSMSASGLQGPLRPTWKKTVEPLKTTPASGSPRLPLCHCVNHCLRFLLPQTRLPAWPMMMN